MHNYLISIFLFKTTCYDNIADDLENVRDATGKKVAKETNSAVNAIIK